MALRTTSSAVRSAARNGAASAGQSYSRRRLSNGTLVRLSPVRRHTPLVETTDRLDRMTDLFKQGKLIPRVGTVLPLEQVRTAHEMLDGGRHKRGKIVLSIAATPEIG